MLYESNGIAGSGKTTLTQKLFSELCKSGIKVTFIGVKTFRGEDQPKFRKLFLKIQRFLLPFNFKNISFFWICLKYFMSKRTSVGWLNSNYENYISLLYCVYIFDSYRKAKDEVIISDEGSIQAITAFSLTRKGSIEYIFQLLKKIANLDLQIIYLCCDIDIAESMHRIEGRSRHNSAIDEISTSALQKYLVQYQYQLHKILDTISSKKCLHVNMNNDIDSLIQEILKIRG
ncbi:hypothetical protein ATX28_07495 [Oenococcus oeni]|uniref:hypothetical protein n=1 Tax=Oenococcus oeni TaxID=1247 RepID=UPI0009526840|nr:hypothetical protein [Oenococcus oeni]OLQ39292.1 hypothetical protein ATX28_07495 [Oenococcus oeni]